MRLIQLSADKATIQTDVEGGTITWECHGDQGEKHVSRPQFAALSAGDRAAIRDAAQEWAKERARRAR